ncbi:hypothetical protein BV25DRAFT_1669303 [Artomyces pyxidatus]|uniref:Uncharacterized protein n=1 Tax=Artomyces pyxidatus TaxID=48021 RepID=A0ACB8SJ65_9AGAM|nr:hypothetical protein BV25DRAFT_1669303 [Artomyces pyxidatus]
MDLDLNRPVVVMGASHPDSSSRSNFIAQPPIAQLPVEILSTIFSYIPSMLNEDGSTIFTYTTDGFPTWLAVTDVCRHWRRVAYECRPLWAYIPLGNIEWTRIALEQSKPGPIVIDIPDNFSGIDVDAVIISFESMDRVVDFNWWSYIDFKDDPSKVRRIFDRLFCASTPTHLQSLTICLRTFYQGTLVEIPDTLFMGQSLPELSEVTFSGPINIKAPTLLHAPSLTCLDLTEVGVGIWATMADVVETLRALPLLQTLSLIQCLPALTDVQPTRIDLPHLTLLCLVDGIMPAAKILPFLFIPACEDLDLELDLRVRGTSEQDVHAVLKSTLVDMFALAAPTESSYRFVNICPTDGDLQDMTRRTIQACDPHPAGLGGLPTRFQLGLVYPDDVEEYGLGSDAPLKYLFVDTLRHLPISRVQSLQVANFIFEHDFNWVALFSICTELSDIAVIGIDVTHALFTAMVHSWRTNFPVDANTPSPHPVPLRHLSTITVYETDFTKHRGTKTPIMDQTLSIIAARRDDYYPPFRLILSDCPIAPDKLQELRDDMGLSGPGDDLLLVVDEWLPRSLDESDECDIGSSIMPVS